MKHKLELCILLIAVILCLSGTANAQPFRITLEESVFTRSIKWYHDNTVSFLKTVSNRGVKADLNGIVMVELLERKDSVYLMRVDTTEVYEVMNKGQLVFRIVMVPSILIEKPRPTFYCIHEGMPIVIYTGIESGLVYDKKMDGEYRRLIINRSKNFIPFPGTKLYEISINNQSGEFKAKELPQ